MQVIGRFAPSPTGPLHAGSLVAALASWLDARAQGGRWLVRIEDIDRERCRPVAAAQILDQLDALGLHSDEAPVRQSERGALYAAALARLVAAGRAYPCTCTRREIEAAAGALGASHDPGAEWRYPGTCRPPRGAPREHGARAWRFALCADTPTEVLDRRLGPHWQDVAREVGDFVLRRSDGMWAYQLAVVVDDAAQGVTDVVRGEDLLDNAPRQRLLQRALGLPEPRYLHVPLVLASDGRKLSKQHGAAPVDAARPLAALEAAGGVLGLRPLHATSPAQWRERAIVAWRERWLGADVTGRV